MALSVLPIAAQPLPDESFSSWLVRGALALGLKPYSLTHALWPRLAILTRDIDNSANTDLIAAFAYACNVEKQRAMQTALLSLEGRLFARHYPHGRTQWVLRAGVYHRARTRCGCQYCPYCLSSDIVPYLRMRWRIACSTVCTKHRVQLHDRCPACSNPISVFRLQPPATHVAICSECNADLRCAPGLRAPDGALFLQRIVDDALSNGAVNLGTYRDLVAMQFFQVLRQVLRITSTGARSHQLRLELHQQFGVSPGGYCFQSGAKEVESLETKERVRLFSAVAPLIDDWPRRFVNVCRNAHIWSFWALHDCRDPPAALWEPIARHLSPCNVPKGMDRAPARAVPTYLRTKKKLNGTYSARRKEEKIGLRCNRQSNGALQRASAVRRRTSVEAR